MTKAPIFPCVGGKGRLRGWIAEYMPQRISGVYCEPFAGRGNVFWLMSQRYTPTGWRLNDLHQYPFFMCLARLDQDAIPESAADAIALCGASRDARVVLSSFLWWSSTFTLAKSPGANWNAAVARQRIGQAKAILVATGPTITCDDYMRTLEALGDGDFAYIDPPYIDTKTCRAIDHRELIGALENARFGWLLSGYRSHLYAKHLGEPLAIKSLAMSVGSNRGRRTECLWRGKL